MPFQVLYCNFQFFLVNKESSTDNMIMEWNGDICCADRQELKKNLEGFRVDCVRYFVIIA